MPEWRAFSGESVEEIHGWGWINSVHPDDRSAPRLLGSRP
jgi:hypothetical protein